MIVLDSAKGPRWGVGDNVCSVRKFPCLPETPPGLLASRTEADFFHRGPWKTPARP